MADEESWHRHRTPIFLFAGLNFLHTIFIIAISLVSDRLEGPSDVLLYCLLFGVYLPASILLGIFSILRCRRDRDRRWSTPWYLALSVVSVMLACGASVRTIVCIGSGVTTCADNRPLLGNVSLWATLGPLFAMMLARNRLIIQAIFTFVMVVLLIVAQAMQEQTWGPWVAVVFVIAANALSFYLWLETRKIERQLDIRARENEGLLQSALEAKAQVLETERLRNQVTSYIFHEIRNPMNIMILSSELLDSDRAFLDVLSVDARENFTRIRQALGSMENVINDALDFRKMGDGQLQVIKRPFVFHEVMRSAIWNMQNAWKEKNIACEAAFDPGIDAIQFKFLGDDLRMNQIIVNYLSNAAKFTPSQGHITVRSELLERHEHSCRVRLSVTDTGVGISEEDQKKLFHAFVQIDSGARSSKQKGTGLGLSICASLIRAMNGTYGVTSVLNVGSTFWFEVPFDYSEVLVGKSTDSPPGPTTSNSLNSSNSFPTFPAVLRVLVVDDDKLQRDIMRRILNKLGHVVDEADDGEVMLEKMGVPPAPYDVVFCDNQMLRMDGLEAIDIARTRGHTLAIISLTGTTDDDVTFERLYKAGATKVLVKPASVMAIRKTLIMCCPVPNTSMSSASTDVG